jgi:DNA-binding CsgD family transcriptional regulator
MPVGVGHCSDAEFRGRGVVRFAPSGSRADDRRAPPVIGRTNELETISRRLDAGGALILEGDAGIGKTTLWRAGVELARERGFRVLVAGPTEAEQSLSYAVLADLLAPVAGEVLPSLPEPQRRALERVLLVAAGGEPLDARLVGVAVQTSLAALGAQVLVAVDDIQWLDAASAAALAFALRRSTPVGTLLALRSGDETSLRLEAEKMPIGPLSVGALHHLLVERLGVALRRTPLLRLHDISGGNPFYALELARANPDGREMVLPASLGHLVVDRVRALPAETRWSLAVLALGGEGDGLAPAIAVGIVEETGGRFRFAHPLFAEAAVGLLSATERRALHAAIARRTTNPERRARHLAYAAAEPDETVAESLAEAAQAAAHRGAFAAAAELWELAAQLTPPANDQRPVRAVEAGIAHVLAGNREAGGALLDANLERLTPGPLRQRGLVHLALRLAREDSRAGVSLLEGALAEAAEPRLRHEVLLLLARFLDRVDEPERADEIVEDHLLAAEESGEPAVLEDALLLAASRRLASDRPVWDLLGRAREIAAARDGDPRRAWGWAPMTAALLRDDRIDEARAALDERRSESVRVGTADYDYGLLQNLSIIELAAGKARLAYELADEALTIAEQIDEPSLVSFALMLAVFPLVVLGEVDAARRHGHQALELAERVQAATTTNGVYLALGLLELSLGHLEAAAETYRRLTPAFRPRLSNVAGGRGALDMVEAFAAVGDLERAAELTSRLPDDAHEKPLAEACVAAARGELSRAIELARSAGPSPAPFRRAREQLLLGRLLRRARRKREARAALETARDGFLALEAPLWVERAAEELARLGGRSPAGAVLTESERRVAELVASGLSNKQVATRLVVTVRTVEWHLSKVYEKLGIDSRAALAASWASAERAKTVDLRSTA